MELHPHRHQYRALIISLFVALALISLTMVSRYQRTGMVREPLAVNTNMPTSIPLTLIPTEKQTIIVNHNKTSDVRFVVQPMNTDVLGYRLGESITLKIVGTTGGKKVVGYDVLMSGGKQAYDIVSVKSLLPDFTVLKFAKNDHLTITGVLKPSIKTQKAFENTPIVEIIITPRQLGSLNLQIVPEIGKETSKIITVGSLGNSERIYAGVSDNLRLDIKP